MTKKQVAVVVKMNKKQVAVGIKMIKQLIVVVKMIIIMNLLNKRQMNLLNKR